MSEPSKQDIEALATVISRMYGSPTDPDDHLPDHCRHMARAILGSDWLAERDTQMRRGALSGVELSTYPCETCGGPTTADDRCLLDEARRLSAVELLLPDWRRRHDLGSVASWAVAEREVRAALRGDTP